MADARLGATTLVVPCYDEAARLDTDAFVALAEAADLNVLFVDDGSTDGTGSMLDAVAAAHPERVRVLHLGANQGKGEAVRLGLLAAREAGAFIVGYCDADLATPAGEVARLVALLQARDDLQVVFAARVGLLGHDVKRSLPRHYLGRVFATASSLLLDLTVYDTQCGAKVFRASPVLDRAVAVPFTSRWAFDVELLGRLTRPCGDEPAVPLGAFLEVPLVQWRDVRGSKMRLRHAVSAGADLVRIRARLLAWQRGGR